MSFFNKYLFDNASDFERERGFKYCIFVGNCVKWRRLDVVLEAFRILNYKYVKLVVVGKGWDKTIHRFLKRNNPFKDSIIYLNDVEYENMNVIYSMCDVYVQMFDKPYTFLAMGRSMVEAVRSNLFVIGSGEILDDYVPSSVVSVGLNDSVDLADALRSCLLPKVLVYKGGV